MPLCKYIENQLLLVDKHRHFDKVFADKGLKN